MNILIISQYYYPEQFQINDIAPALIKKGNEVTVLCGLPNYPQGTVYPGYRSQEKSIEIIEGVKVIRCWQLPRLKGTINLALNYISNAYSSTRKAKSLKEKFDVVLCYQLSPVTMALPSLAYKKKHNVPVLLYCLDIWPESAQAHVWNDTNMLYRFIRKLSKVIYNQCDKILVTSKPFIRYLYENNGVPIEKIGYLPQHADSLMLTMDLTAEENGCVDFMFTGNLGAGQILDTLVLAAAELGVRSDYRLHFVGDGSRRNTLENLVKEKRLENNIFFYGNQKREDMPAFYKKADVLLISLRGNNAVGDTMPGKLQVYMTTGKPILGAINGAAREIISEAQCGKCVGSGDYKGLAGLMLDYMEHPYEYASCGENARRYFKANFTLDKYVEGLESELEKLAK